MLIQWGSEYQTSLYLNGLKEVGCQIVWFLSTGQPNHLNTGQMAVTDEVEDFVEVRCYAL